MTTTVSAYYLGYDLTAALVQVYDGSTTTTYELAYPNKVSPSTEKDTYTWKGGGKTKKIESLASVNLTLDLDCLPFAAHKAIFGHTTISSAASSGMTAATMVGIGGGNDAAGKSVGIILEGNSIKVAADGTESVVKVRTWYPVGTLTLAAPPAFSAGSTADKWQYAFSASKTAVDIAGATITGADTGGNYAYVGEAA